MRVNSGVATLPPPAPTPRSKRSVVCFACLFCASAEWCFSAARAGGAGCARRASGSRHLRPSSLDKKVGFAQKWSRHRHLPQ